jgi:hypothetical protein
MSEAKHWWHDAGVFYFACPHCKVLLAVEEKEINCGVFRCGVVKQTNQQVPPHTPKPVCDALAAQNLIWGCGKPFKFDGECVAVCGYV